MDELNNANKQSIVSLIRCDDYNLDDVKQKMLECVNLLGGIEKFIKKDSKVFVKLNCIGPFPAEMGITTHPVFVDAIISLILTQTKNIIIGDNPATRDITYTLKKNGVYQVVEKYGLQIINPKELVKINNPDFKTYSTFEVSKDMIECDTLINLGKLKTHTLTYMTGAQKNYFGLIFGLNKAGWHVKANNPLAFAEAFNDLYGALLYAFKDKTILNFSDGILGLEGEGPSTGGKPKKANCILASTDAISLDVIASKVVKLKPDKLILALVGAKRNLGIIDDIKIVGNSLDDFKDIEFKQAKSTTGSFGLRLIKNPFFRNILLEHPKINHNKCIRCGECAKICPPHTMKIEPKSFPKLNSSKCIRCWCCAEVCPQNAIIKTKRPIIGRIVFK